MRFCNQALGCYGYCPHKNPTTLEDWLERPSKHMGLSIRAKKGLA